MHAAPNAAETRRGRDQEAYLFRETLCPTITHPLRIWCTFPKHAPAKNKYNEIPYPTLPATLSKPSDLKQQLKHTDVHSLCMAASTDKALAAHPRRGFSATTGAAPGGMAGMVQDFQQMAAFGGRGMKGRVKNMLISIKGAFGGRTTGRTQMRCDSALHAKHMCNVRYP